MHKYLIIIITSLSFAADYAGYSGTFLRMGTSARSLAMGSGFTAEIDQGFSAYHNPASVAFLNKRQLAFSHHGLNLDRRLMMSSISTSIPPTAGLGVAWVSSGVDNIQGRSTSGYKTQILSTSEDAIFISFAQRITPWLALGINVKILNHQLPMNESELAGKGTGFDIGFMVLPEEKLRFAFMIQDLNTNYQWNTGQVFEGEGRIYKESFPTMYRLGTTFTFQRIYFVGDIGVVANQDDILGMTMRFGGEYQLSENYFIRGGFGNSRFSLGAGLNFTFLNLNDAFFDYAVVIEPHSASQGMIHVFTYAFNF
ncbi:hypothetical protein MGWOODY_Mmi1289 [hydrothermal vent metagenome]|uniref:PorV/PorQ family protein n=1 Tax=hydrothermal vent metagenome TaxID=652676 RepID=A0A160VGQ5_9ZZZZ